MSEILHTLFMPRQSSQNIKAMIDFSKMWIEGSSPMFHHQSISAELVVLQSLPEVQSIMQTAQLSYNHTLPFTEVKQELLVLVQGTQTISSGYFRPNLFHIGSFPFSYRLFSHVQFKFFNQMSQCYLSHQFTSHIHLEFFFFLLKFELNHFYIIF